MRKMWVVVGVVAVLAAGGGTWVWASSDHGPSAPPDVPLPQQAALQVNMCGKDSIPKCRPLATEQDHQAVLAKLNSLPGVTDQRIASGAKLGLDDAFVKATLADRDAFPKLKPELEAMKGVEKATAWPKLFWTGKADVSIELCGQKLNVGQCEGRGPATEAEKDAIYERLRQLPDVSEVYLADRDFVLREAKDNLDDGMSGVWTLTMTDPHEVFYVKFVQEDPKAKERIKAIFSAFPGVQGKYGVN